MRTRHALPSLALALALAGASPALADVAPPCPDGQEYVCTDGSCECQAPGEPDGGGDGCAVTAPSGEGASGGVLGLAFAAVLALGVRRRRRGQRIS